MLEPGRVVDRYEVLSVLGEGGMATVYRVRHTTLGSEHALKVLTVTAAAVTERLLAEGRVQAGLDHPFALTVTDVVDVDGAPGLVMELVKGGTLEDWVLSDPPRDARIRVFRQVLQAVESAHAQGWIHRDLKPGNVLMKGSGTDAIPKVADFGLVKAVSGEARPGGRRTRDGVAMGTPGYMAPEQIEDAAAVDPRADVYSLGCILVFLLTGEPAFEGEVIDVFAAVAAGRHRSLPEGDPLRPLVEACLARSPADRPADAGALRQGIDALGDRALAPPDPPVRTGPERPLVPALAGVAGLVGLLGLGCLCGAGFLGMVLPTGGSRGSEPVWPVGAPETPRCAAAAERTRLGYALVPRATLALDDVHLLVEPADVLPRARDREAVRCTLRAGTRVVVREVPRSPRQQPERMWLAIYADAITPP